MTENNCAVYVPQWQEKLGWKLFPTRIADMPDLVDAHDCLVLRVTSNLSWLDRIRVLISGTIQIESRTVTQGIIADHKTNSEFTAVAPKWLQRK